MEYKDPYAQFNKLTAFRPIYTKEQTARMVNTYQRVPHGFNAGLVNEISKHADHHKIPFQQYQIQKEDPFSVLRGIRQLSEGWLSGFSTFHVGREEPASNRFERIMRAVGDVSGFAGFIPAAPFKLLKLGKLANLVTKYRGKSVPLLLSGAATRQTKKVIKPILQKASRDRVGAFNDAASFLLKDVPSHVAEGAFNLGIASAVGSWQQGISAMLQGGLQGAAMGGVFRGLGNLINRGGPPKLDKKTGKYILTATHKEDMVIRGAAGALYTGLPSTLAGQTTEEQVYEYLLGAFFGSRETSAVQHKSQKFAAKVEKLRRKDPEKITKLDDAGLPLDLKDMRYDPKLVPGFDLLSEPVKKSVLEDAKTRYGTWGETFSAMGLSIKKGGYEGFKEDLTEQIELQKAVAEVEKESQKIKDEYPEITAEEQANVDYLVQLRENLVKKYKIHPDRFDEITRGSSIKAKMEAFLAKDPEFQTYKDTIFGKEKPLRDKPTKTSVENTAKETKDGDISESSSRISIENNARRFVTQFLKNKIAEAQDIQREVIIKANTQKVADFIENRKTGKIIDSKGLIKDIESEFKISLSSEAKGELRQNLIRKNMDKPIKHFSVMMIPYKGGVAHKLMELPDKKPWNMAGNLKDQRESPKLYDEVYKLIAKKHNLNPPTGRRPWVVLDHFTMQTKDKGMPIEKNIKDIDTFIKGKLARQEFRARIIRDMAQNHGYYYFGGKGDTGRMYFYSPHPEATRILRLKKGKKELDKIIKLFGNKESKYYGKIKQDFINKNTRYGKKGMMTVSEANKYFDNAFLSNIMWNIDMNGLHKKGYKSGLEFLIKHSDISDLKNFNKRSQIWLTDGYSMESSFLTSKLLTKGKSYTKKERNAIQKGKLRYILVNDNNVPNLLKDSPASYYKEGTDGSILIHPDYIDGMNEAFGMPYSGQNKSFIVSPDTTHGALLGKFMFHKASGRAANWMRKQGLGMVMFKSAAKDTGSREAIDLDVDSKFKVTTSAPLTDKNIYELPMADVKGSLSEKQGEHMAENKNTPKQLMVNLVKWANVDIPQRTIDNMFNDWIRTKYDGVSESNTKLRDFVQKDPRKVSEADFQEIIKDIDNYGLADMMDAIKNTKHHRLVTHLYKTILRKNAQNLQEMRESEEISSQDYDIQMKEVKEFNSAIDRMFNLNPHISIFLYKDARNYLNKALRNFAVYQVTRPLQPNSLDVRMRPYDPWLRQEKHMKKLETDDNVFYLDDLFRSKSMDVTGIISPKKGRIKSFMTLGELWDNHKSDPKVQEFLTSISMRVPMDSLSGAHKLRFNGFTGIEGHGAVFHPRTMKALGGADLDGDKAFVFFGMKPEYKDVYHNQKFEFEKGGKIKDNKKDSISKEGLKILKESGFNTKGVKTFEDLLTAKGTGEEKNHLNSKLGMYTPNLRMQISENAAKGRDQLGPAVSSRQKLFATHAELMVNPTQRYKNIKTGQTTSIKKYKAMSPDQKKLHRVDNRDSFPVRMWNPKKKDYETKWVYIKPRKGKKALDFARELARAEISFASDPLDVIGLTGRPAYFEHLYHSLFEIQSASGKKIDIKPHMLRKGMYRKIDDFNSAYFSKDFYNNRSWTPDEVSDMSLAIRDFGENQKTTFLPKMVELLEPLDISDDIMTRYNKDLLNQRYKDYDSYLKELEPYLKILNRASFKSPKSPFVDHVFNNDLHDLKERQRISQNPEKFMDIFKKEVWFGKKKRPFIPVKEMWEYVPEISNKAIDKEYNRLIKEGVPEDKALWILNKTVRDAQKKRLLFLNNFMVKASDFAQNDMMDRTSGQMLQKYIELYRATGGSDSFISTVNNFAEDIKMMERVERRKAMRHDLEESVIVNLSKADGEKIRHVLDGDTKTPAWAIRRDIDNRIQDFKDNNVILKRKLNRAESNLVDAMLLNSYYKGKTDKVTEELSKLAKTLPVAKKIIDAINRESSGSYFSKVGVNSEKVSDDVLQDYLKTFQKEFENVSIKPEKESDLDITTELNNEMPDVKLSGNPDPIKAEIKEGDLEGIRRAEILQGVDPDVRAVAKDLGEHLKFYHGSIGRDINLIARGMIGKNLDAMDLQDMRAMNNMFNDMRTGNWFMQDMNKLMGGVPKLSKRHWLMFPRAISEEMMVKDFMIAKEQGFFKNYKGQTAEGTVGSPTHFIERTQFIIGEMNALAIRHNQDSTQEIQDKLRDQTGYESIKEGYDIHDMAFMQREKSIIEDIKNDKYKTKEERDTMIKAYQENIDSVSTRIDWDNLKGKEFYVNTINGKETLTGQQLADRISDVYTDLAISRFKRIRGAHYDWNPASNMWEQTAPDPLSKFYITDKKGNVEHWDRHETLPKVDTVKFFNHMMGLLKEGKPITMDYGLDGMRKISKSIMFENKMLSEEALGILSNIRTEETGHFKPTTYNPHIIKDTAKAKVALEKMMKRIQGYSGPNWTPEKKKKELQRLVLDYHRLSGDYIVQDVVDWHMYQDVLNDINNKRKESPVLKAFANDPKAPSMYSRRSNLPGWETDPSVWETYDKSLIDTYYRQIGQIMSRQMFNEFTEKYKDKWPEELWQGWSNFYADYINGAQGYPNYIPDEWLHGDMAKHMNVKGTPYAWWADNVVAKRVNSIAEKLGFSKGSASLPSELRKYDANDLRHWSNLEAKYQMAALLAHPKSSIANLYGGTMHTVESTGWTHFKNSGNLDFIKTMLPRMKDKDGNPVEWTKEALERWVVRHGVIPEYMVYEAGLNPALKGAKWKRFMEDATSLLKKDDRVKDETLKTLAKKYNITENIFEKAAWFMREPERILRRRAFIAHYLQARELLGNADMPLDHPFLIAKAKKGVQATQFLYSAPYRPAFSRTALGKVMTRFQTWAWNSVRFRNDVIKEARQYGYTPGSPEFERFKRMQLTDAFVFSLANVFAYSLFEAALPAPYSWFQDTADWLFGNENERDRAFFGQWPTAVAPLQMVTPAILRMVPATFSAISKDDYSKLSGYYAWSMFPFGRIAYDAKGIIKNPMMTVEKMTGLPYIQFAQEFTKYRKKEDE